MSSVRAHAENHRCAYNRAPCSADPRVQEPDLSDNGSNGGAEIKAVRTAKESLRVLLRTGELDPRDLREQAAHRRPSSGGDSPSSGDVSLAFWRLLNRGEIELTDNRTVRLAS